MKIVLGIFTVLTLIGSTAPALATGNLLHTFNDPTVTSEDQFGISVALDGNYALVGARRDNTQGANIGQAHLFDATTGSLLHTLNDPTVTGSDQFGFSVAVAGNRLLVGAPDDDTNGLGVGQAYLFDGVSGNLLHTLNDPTTGGTGDVFGFEVSVTSHYALIGAPGDSTNGVGVGQAHLFDTVTGNLLHTFNDPTVTNNDRFGQSVSVSGNHVLIGAPLDDTDGSNMGQAHLFDAVTGNLLQTFSDPTISFVDLFGSSVSVDGNLVLIGAPDHETGGSRVGQAHLFDATTGNLLHTFDDPTFTFNDFFGSSVQVQGNRVFIGAEGDRTFGNRVGQAHLFDATSGNLLHTFDDPTVTSTDLFGASVALNGNRVLIGAYEDDTFGTNVGQAHLFAIIPEPSSISLLVSMGLLVIANRLRRL